MSAPVRIGAFLLAMLVALGVGAGLGASFGPEPAARAPASTEHHQP